MDRVNLLLVPLGVVEGVSRPSMGSALARLGMDASSAPRGVRVGFRMIIILSVCRLGRYIQGTCLALCGVKRDELLFDVFSVFIQRFVDDLCVQMDLGDIFVSFLWKVSSRAVFY